MNQLEYRKAYNLDELISKIMSGYKKDNFCLYTKEYESSARADLICYLEMYPVISDDDDEVYPEFVINNSLELFLWRSIFRCTKKYIYPERKPINGRFYRRIKFLFRER